MKRNVLCIFSFLLILLVFFTLVSSKAEEEMHTLVDARHGEGKGDRNLSIGNIAIIWPNSNDILFNITQGNGWESGLRIAEIPSAYFDRVQSHVELGAGTDYWYIYSASREPIAGDAVTVVEQKRGEDIYLLWHPDDIGNLDGLTNSMEAINRSQNAALVSSWAAKHPFFEHNIWYTLKGNIGEDLRIYSLHDIEQFANALPWIAGMIALLLCSLILWGTGWFLSGKTGCSKSVLVINIFLIALLLISLPLLLNQFDLPASLLPQESILDISHYTETFHRITAAMESMRDDSVQNWLSQAITASAIVVGLSILFTVAISIAEGMICHRRGKEKPETTE